MSSEQLADGVNPLDAELAATWDVLKGYSGRDTDLGIARRFGGAAAAYSLRNVGTDGLPVVRVRREPNDNDGITTPSVEDETDFSAHQVQGGILEDWVNGKLETDLPASVNYERAVKVTISHSLIDSGNTKTLTMFVGSSSDNNTHENGFLRYYGYIGSTVYKLYNSPSSVNWRFRLESSPNTDYAVSSNNAIPENVTDVPSWENGDDGGTLNSFSVVAATPAAAAYSLRKVNSTYSGNAVRIRRSSDGVEVNVAFDSDDKVSSSSAITNTTEQGGESGQTTTTDLNEFLNETLTVGVAVGGGSGGSRPDSFTNATNSSFTATVTATAGGYFPYKTATGDVITVSFDLELSGGASPSACTSTSINTVNNASPSILYTSSGSYTSSFTCTTDATHFRFADGDDGTFAVTNFRIVSHTHQAFVHTWYDQAGSSDAVQATASKQPTIAENGALLADGIDFDGTDDYLDFSEDICDNINSFSAFVQAKSDGDTSSQIIFSTGFSGNSNIIGLGRGSTHSRISYSNNTYDIATVDALENGCLLSIIAGSSTVKGFNNAVEGTSQSSVSDNPPESGGLGAHNGTGSFFDGKIKEAIFYKSDQTNNRFKIESNINNYYGLYNDANDLSSTSFTVSGGTLSGSNTTDGFTCATTTSSEVRANFKNLIPSRSSNFFTFHMSFNADLANPAGSGGNGSPIVRLLNSSEAVTTSAHTVTQGFNSFSNAVNQNAGTDSTILEFFDNDNDTSYSISDIKISLIARNGFVETWYDQSGNGNNAVQGTADKQPKIVSNGGTHKLEGLPAINFDDATSHCLTSSNYSRSGSDLPLSMMAVFDKSTTDTDYLFAANKSDDDAFQRLVLRSTTFEYGERDDANTQKVGNGGSPSLNTTFLMSAFTGGTTSSVFINGSSILSDVDTNLGTQTFDQIDIGANNGDGASSNNPFSGNISELYLFETNLSTDRTTIEGEIANHYNITLS